MGTDLLNVQEDIVTGAQQVAAVGVWLRLVLAAGFDSSCPSGRGTGTAADSR